MAVAVNAGFAVDAAKARHQITAVREDREKSRLRMFEGGGAINAQVGFGYAILGFAAAKTPPNQLTDAMAFFLLKRQSVDGGWVSESHRPPLEDKRETATALAVRGLLAYTPLELRHLLPERIAKAREWLIRCKPSDNETRVMRLWGLHWTKAPVSVFSTAARDLLSKQLPDGSWAQVDGTPGDAYATGQALVVLSLSYSWAHPQLNKGVKYLIKTQKPDGSWHVKTRRIGKGLPYFDTGFPHGEDQFISYAGTAWAVIALVSRWSRDSLSEFTYVPKPLKSVERPRLFAKDPATNRLFHVVAFGTVDEVEAVLKEGADPNVRNEVGGTPLIWASADPAKTKLLLAYKADPKLASKSGRNALYSAAFSYEGREACRALLDAGADANLGAIATGPPLTAACLSMDDERIDMLLKAGAKPHVGIYGAAPTTIALIVGNEPVTARLARGNPRLNALDDGGYGLLFDAINMDSPAMLNLLLKSGCDANVTFKGDGMTPLHWAAVNNVGHGELVKRLLVAGARKDAKNKAGKTPLDLARERGNAAAVKALREFQTPRTAD